MKRFLLVVSILVLLTACGNGNTVYNCSYNVSDTGRIEIIIESNAAGEVLYITDNTYHEDLNEQEVENLKDNFNHLINELLPDNGIVETTYEITDNYKSYTSTIVIDVKNIDEGYPIEVLVYGYNDSENVDDLIDSMESAGMTCRIE